MVVNTNAVLGRDLTYQQQKQLNQMIESAGVLLKYDLTKKQHFNAITMMLWNYNLLS